MTAAAKRTQRERRESMIRRLLDAATEVVIDVGYGEASVQRICARADVSQGALFRHFATREALMLAVVEDVGAKLLAEYRVRFESLPARARGDVATALRLLRASCRSRLNSAWYELAMAARTSEPLRRGLEPVARRYHDNIARVARELFPALSASLGEAFDVLVTTMIAVFDGEVVHRLMLPPASAADEDARIDLLAGAIGALVPEPRQARPARRGRAKTGISRSV